MKSKTGSGYVLWLVAGTAFLALLVTVMWHVHDSGNATEELASKASRVDLVGRMQLDLASASEAEKSAVLAVTDEESHAFANDARAATAALAHEEEELGRLLETGGSQREKDLLTQFSVAFGELRRIDDEVLALAVKNTNVKAYGLLFGPATQTLAEMDAALARVVARYADSTDGKRVMEMAFGARIGVLRIQTLLAPHIAEENDAKMDQMEASMVKEETQIRKDLDGLAALTRLAGDTDVAAAASRFAHYEEVKAQILPLSRENTNVRSLAMSLNQKRKAMILCQDALDALRQAIFDEPIARVTYGPPPKPR